MAGLAKSLDINSVEANTPYETRVQQRLDEQQNAGMFGGDNKWLIIGGLALAAYLAFGPQPKKTKSSGLNAPKSKKRKKSKTAKKRK